MRHLDCTPIDWKGSLKNGDGATDWGGQALSSMVLEASSLDYQCVENEKCTCVEKLQTNKK